jgi:hypothetical protein
MIESVLVADRGLGAARVLTTCRRLGIKAVLAGLSDDSGDDVATDATHLADDEVLLANVAELVDPTAVVRAADSAGVQAIHPGYGLLRGDLRLARAAAEAGLAAVVTTGLGPPEEIAIALGGERPPLRVAPPGTPTTRWVYVLAGPTQVTVLGSVRVASDGSYLCAADDVGEGGNGDSGNGDGRNDFSGDGGGTEAAHRTGHAVAAVLGVSGLCAVGISAAGITGAGPGLPTHHAVWELVADLDLVELQLRAADGDAPSPSSVVRARVGGVAIGRPVEDIVDDVRSLDAVAGDGLRIDAVGLAGSSHGALVRVSAWGADRAAAELTMRRYLDLRS